MPDVKNPLGPQCSADYLVGSRLAKEIANGIRQRIGGFYEDRGNHVERIADNVQQLHAVFEKFDKRP